MGRRCEKMRGRIRTQDARRMRMKSENHRRPSHLVRLVHRPTDQGLMAKVHAVEDPDRHAKRSGNFREFRK